MENIILFLSNLYGLRAVYSFLSQSAYIPSGFLLGAIVASSQYHLIENIKHPLTGITKFLKIEISESNLFFLNKITLNIDRFFAIGSILVIFEYSKCFEDNIILFALVASICGMISETLPKKVKYNKIFVLLHSIWHILAFHIAYLFSLN